MFPKRGHIGVAKDRHALAQLAGFLTFEPDGSSEADRAS
jgi:hypothetical protein